jgi:hypothetical protein
LRAILVAKSPLEQKNKIHEHHLESVVVNEERQSEYFAPTERNQTHRATDKYPKDRKEQRTGVSERIRTRVRKKDLKEFHFRFQKDKNGKMIGMKCAPLLERR